MKNIIKHGIKVLVSVFSLVAVSSCEKYLEIPLPSNSLSTESAFNTEAVIDKMMYNLYNSFVTNVSAPIDIERYSESLADNGYNPTASYLLVYMQNTMLYTDYPPIPWSGLYKTVFLANSMLEGLPNADAVGFTEDEKNAYIAASKTIRAYTYYQLVRGYGDVPLITTTDANENKIMPRSPKADVYALIEEDLKDAIGILPAEAGLPYYINCKYIPQSVLADVYLTEGKWEEAEAAATAVISSGNYSLVNELNDVFLQGSTETIMATGYTDDWYGTSSLGASPGASVLLPPVEGFYASWLEQSLAAISPSLLSSFEEGDQRKEKWITLRNTGAYEQPEYRMFPYKYRYNMMIGEIPEAGREDDQKLYRLAELYLIRAEARAMQNNLSGAAEDLNVIRNRAGLANTIASTRDQMIDAILHERRVELFFEKGTRWFDLVRTGRADAVLNAIPYKAGNWKSYMALWPVPKEELNYNPNLTQTPGW